MLRVEKIQLHKLQAGDTDQINLGAQALINQPLQRGAIRKLDQVARSIRDHVLIQLSEHDDLRLAGCFIIVNPNTFHAAQRNAAQFHRAAHIQSLHGLIKVGREMSRSGEDIA